MSISISGNLDNYMMTRAGEAGSSARYDKTRSKLSGLSSSSSKEELEKAAETFESYFVEKFLKETVKSIKSEDSSISQYTDLYMDSVLGDISDTIVKRYGGRFTDSMVEQMARNYHIDISGDSEEKGSDGEQ